MKNKLIIVLVVFWFIIALLLVGLLINRITGKNSHILFNSEVADRVFGDSNISLTLDDLSPGDINTLYKNYSFSSSEVDEFSVELVTESVEVAFYDGYDVSVGLYGNWNTELEPKVQIERRKLVIKKPDIHITDWSNLGCRQVVIKVPVHAGSKLYDADISNISGSIYLSDLSFRDLSIDSVSGSVHFDGSVASLDADTVSGNIQVSGFCENLKCDSVSGNIHIVTFNPLKGKNSLNSISGNINLTIPEDEGFEFEWNTVSGSVKNDYYNGKCGKSGSEIIGNGNARIDAVTVSGQIHLIKN